MNLNVSDFIVNRIQEIADILRENNGEYSLAYDKSKSLHENIEPIIHSENSITISAGDCMDFRDLFAQEFTLAAIMQETLYKQGYLDCIRLLSMLGVLA